MKIEIFIVCPDSRDSLKKLYFAYSFFFCVVVNVNQVTNLIVFKVDNYEIYKFVVAVNLLLKILANKNINSRKFNMFIYINTFIELYSETERYFIIRWINFNKHNNTN